MRSVRGSFDVEDAYSPVTSDLADDALRDLPPLRGGDPTTLDFRELFDRGDRSPFLDFDLEREDCLSLSPFDDPALNIGNASGGGGGGGGCGGAIWDIWALCTADSEGFAIAIPVAAIALARPVGFLVVERRHGRLDFDESGERMLDDVFSRWRETPRALVDEDVEGEAEVEGEIMEDGGGDDCWLTAEVEDDDGGNLRSVGLSTIGRIVTAPFTATSCPLAFALDAGSVAALAWALVPALPVPPFPFVAAATLMSGGVFLVRDLFDGCLRT